MNHIVSFSGGIGSWMAAKRVAEKFGTENLYLVFCDTLSEDIDLYRFLDEAAANIGGTLIKLSDGRDIYDVFTDKSYIGNAKTAPCSGELKIKPFYSWIDSNFNIKDVTIYLGIDFTESHRFESAKRNKPKYNIEAPLCEAPFLLKIEMFNELKKSGIELPNLYKLGFAHNNCSGACVKAGVGQFKKLFTDLPDIYRKFELKQEALIEKNPSIGSFLSITKNKIKEELTMRQFRERHLEKDITSIDDLAIGGCGCFLD